jgi:UDP-N-acetylglucosamine 2-epimerase (non-hydrolysing)
MYFRALADISMKKKILVILGTRPEVIKMAPVITALKNVSERLTVFVLSTQQHTNLLDDTAADLGLTIDDSLSRTHQSNDLSEYYPELQGKIQIYIKQYEPDLVLVHGDTASATCGAMASYLLGVPVAHVEAGLRSHNLNSPFPEEGNRKVIDSLSTLLFAPTQKAAENLNYENNVYVTGNTVIDSLKIMINENASRVIEFENRWGKRIPANTRFILVTQHRRESFGLRHSAVIGALIELAAIGHTIVFPVHPNPKIFRPVHELLGGIKNIHLIDPLNYSEFVYLLTRARLIITDSGGLQEEAPSLGVPVLITREITERDEVLEDSLSEIVGSDARTIVKRAQFWMDSEEPVYRGEWRATVFGDGNASTKIAETCSKYLLESFKTS